MKTYLKCIIRKKSVLQKLTPVEIESVNKPIYVEKIEEYFQGDTLQSGIKP